MVTNLEIAGYSTFAWRRHRLGEAATGQGDHVVRHAGRHQRHHEEEDDDAKTLGPQFESSAFNQHPARRWTRPKQAEAGQRHAPFDMQRTPERAWRRERGTSREVSIACQRTLAAFQNLPHDEAAVSRPTPADDVSSRRK